MNNLIDSIDEETIIEVLECYNHNKQNIKITAAELAITPEYLEQILTYVICQEKIGTL